MGTPGKGRGFKEGHCNMSAFVRLIPSQRNMAHAWLLNFRKFLPYYKSAGGEGSHHGQVKGEESGERLVLRGRRTENSNKRYLEEDPFHTYWRSSPGNKRVRGSLIIAG
jgi:hypothetical protein